MRLSLYRLTRLPDDYNDMKSCLRNRITTPAEWQRTNDTEIDMEPGFYSAVPQFKDATGVGFYIRVFAQPDADIGLFRFSEGEGRAMTVGHGVSCGKRVESTIVPSAGTTDADPPADRPIEQKLGFASKR
eukprot:407830_1